MAFVMGIPSAQEILRNVQDDLNESSGVYAILIHLLSFIYPHGLPKKAEGGVGAIFFETNCPSSSATRYRRRYSGLKFGYDNDD
jgi:hypothetical protein